MANNLNTTKGINNQYEEDKREIDNTIDPMINSSDKFYQEQIKASDDYTNQKTELQKQMGEQTVNEIEQNKGYLREDYLKEQKAPIKSARLLKVEEAYDLGCGNGAWNCNNAPSFIKETSFWLGSVNSTSNIWRIDSVGGFGSSGFEGVGTFGVRPVIVI